MRKVLSCFLTLTTSLAMLVTPIMADEVQSDDISGEVQNSVLSTQDDSVLSEQFILVAPGAQLGGMEQEQDSEGHGNGEWQIWGDGDMYDMDGSEFFFQSGPPWYPNIVKMDFVKNSNQQDCTMTSVGASAFAGCEKLETIALPNTVTKIGNNGFNGCKGLQTITLSRDLSTMGENTFLNCTSLDGIIIPSGVTSIGKNSFKGCTALTSISLPAGVTSVAEGTFEGCTSLGTVNFSDNVTELGKNSFKGCTTLEDISLPTGLKTIGEGAFYGCTGLGDVTIPDGVTSIGKNAFKNCTSLEKITIPDSVKSIGEGAFDGCTLLDDVTIPNNVETIGASAFKGCTSLGEISIPDSVDSIGDNAFDGCTSLKDITINGTLSSIGSQAFVNCDPSGTITIVEGDLNESEAIKNSSAENVVYRINSSRCISSDVTCSLVKDNTTIIIGDWSTLFEIAEGSTFTIDKGVNLLNGGRFNIKGKLVNNGSICNKKDGYLFSDDAEFAEVKSDPTHYSGTGTVDCEIHKYGHVDDGICYNCGSLIKSDFKDVNEGSWYYVYVNKAKQMGLMNGYNSTQFGANDKLTRGQLAILIYRLEEEPEVTYENVFPDVPDGKYYTNAAVWCKNNNIITGYENGKFGPNDNITREQAVTIFYRYFKDYHGIDLDTSIELDSYTDADKVSSFAVDGFKFCVNEDIIKGKDNNTKLAPKDNLTRAEAATILLRVVYNLFRD